MSIAYEAGGRTAQKQRTRTALIDAARALVAGGTTPTVEDAAAAASISRATAYRYFPSQWALLVAAHPSLDNFSLLPPDAPADDVAARLELAMERPHAELFSVQLSSINSARTSRSRSSSRFTYRQPLPVGVPPRR